MLLSAGMDAAPALDRDCVGEEEEEEFSREGGKGGMRTRAHLRGGVEEEEGGTERRGEGGREGTTSSC